MRAANEPHCSHSDWPPLVDCHVACRMTAGASGSERLDDQPWRCGVELGLDTYGAVDGVDVFPNDSGRREDAREPGFGRVDFLAGRKRLARLRVQADSVRK